MLALDELPALVPQWIPGQSVRVLAGPLMGVAGQFVRDAGNGRLIVWIELLGVGAAVTLPPDTPVEALDDERSPEQRSPRSPP
jgi:transcription antitermination factor NusG